MYEKGKRVSDFAMFPVAGPWVRPIALLCGPVLLLSIASCGHRSSQPDPMCDAIRQFAQASAPETENMVQLVTDWGFGIDDQGNEYLNHKACNFFGYAPGEVLCQYLMSHTSTEFSSMNFQRALACISFEASSASEDVVVHSLAGEVVSYAMQGVPADTSVRIKFVSGSEYQLPTLTISVERFE